MHIKAFGLMVCKIASIILLLFQFASAKESDVSDKLNSILGLSSQEIQQFLISLKDAVYNNDAQAFSKLLHYPCYWYGEEHIRIDSPEQFIESYEKFITDDIKQVIKQTEFDDLFVNYQGISMGSGYIWFASFGYGINMINPCAGGECKSKNN